MVWMSDRKLLISAGSVMIVLLSALLLPSVPELLLLPLPGLLPPQLLLPPPELLLLPLLFLRLLSVL